MLNKVVSWFKANPTVSIIGVLVLLALLWYFRGSISQAWRGHQVNKQDAQIQKSIDQNAKDAAASETNANTHTEQRQAAEGRAELAQEQKQQAADNSNRTLDPVRKARQRYEETRSSRPADSPALSDEQLCAELAKRGIACR